MRKIFALLVLIGGFTVAQAQEWPISKEDRQAIDKGTAVSKRVEDIVETIKIVQYVHIVATTVFVIILILALAKANWIVNRAGKQLDVAGRHAAMNEANTNEQRRLNALLLRELEVAASVVAKNAMNAASTAADEVKRQIAEVPEKTAEAIRSNGSHSGTEMRTPDLPPTRTDPD